MGYTILVVDDHVLLRKGIKSILNKIEEVDIVMEANDGFDAIEKVRKQDFDIVLLDISMPGKDGMDTLKQLKYELPKLQVLMLSMYPEDRYAIQALKAGASGYLEKDCQPEELQKAVKEILTTGKYISPTVAVILANTIDTTSSSSSYDLLSDREVQVLRLLADAKTNNEIAEQLNISPKTVATYKARILKKLNLKNTAELIRFAIESNLS